MNDLPPPASPPPRPSGDAAVPAAAATHAGAGEAPQLRVGEVVNGKYRLVERIARGGMGEIWSARDLGLERPVAIKFMSKAIAESEPLRERFNREAKAAARLRTVHVVQIFEHGLYGPLPFIAMELLEGEDLHARLQREGCLTPEETARVLVQTAKGLKKAHSQGIVHRDLKPQNLFLAREDDEEVVKILDFGIAKTVSIDDSGDVTKTGHVLGSPHYMSPEQARGLKQIDHRSDVWSLGVIAFRALTGRLAFGGEATGDVIVNICTAPHPVASGLVPGLPTGTDRFFDRALARDPEQRFQTAMDLAQAFADLVRARDDVSLFTPAPAADSPSAAARAMPEAPYGHPPGHAGVSPAPAYPSPGANQWGEAHADTTPLPAVTPAGASFTHPEALPPPAPATSKLGARVLVGLGAATVLVLGVLGALLAMGGGGDRDGGGPDDRAPVAASELETGDTEEVDDGPRHESLASTVATSPEEHRSAATGGGSPGDGGDELESATPAAPSERAPTPRRPPPRPTETTTPAPTATAQSGPGDRSGKKNWGY